MPSQPSTAGARFGRYRLVERLGVGGMAAVFRAVVDGPDGFTRSLVIKRVLPVYSSNPAFTRMLADEARLCGLLHHPSIVQVYEFDKAGDEHYLAMEYVEGVDLSTLLNRCRSLMRPIPVGVVCYIVQEVAAALAYAHDLRDGEGRPLEIVHRDISPSNIMITASGQVKLLDFGIAKAAHQLRTEKTDTGCIKGKLAYLAPEQAQGLPADRRSDLFALGVVMHECLTQRRLFSAPNDFATLQLVSAAKVTPPSSLRAELPPELDAVVLKLLARTPAGRYASGEEVVAALAPIIHPLHGDAAGLRRFIADLGPIPKRAALEDTDPAHPLAEATPSTLGLSAGESRPAVRRRLGSLRAAGGGVAVLGAGALLAAILSHRAPHAMAPRPAVAQPIAAAAVPPPSPPPVVAPAVAPTPPPATPAPLHKPTPPRPEGGHVRRGTSHPRTVAKKPAPAAPHDRAAIDDDTPDIKNPFSR